MISVDTPKNLNKVKTKVVGNLTKRQLVCFGGAGLVGIPFYLFVKQALGTDLAAILMICVAMPFFVFAMYEKNGMPAEKYLGLIIRHRVLTEIRPYVASNLFLELEKREKMKKEVAYLEEKARIGKDRKKDSGKKAVAEKAGNAKTADNGRAGKS